MHVPHQLERRTHQLHTFLSRLGRNMYLFTPGRTLRFAPDAHSGIRARYSRIDA